ncbi:MAG: GNAT family N-acetyltransferase [Bacilli bacterium]|nr:GNAT family N-acetyltransferase [Bacilli bacterium]
MIREYLDEDKERIVELGLYLKGEFDFAKLSTRERIVVYEEDGLVEAFIVFSKLYEVLDILYIVVAEDFRKRGLGTTLIDFVATSEIKRVMLEVRETNTIAIEFYKKNGFKIVREIENYYGGKDKAFAMEKVC